MSFLDHPGDLAEVPLAAVLIEALNHRATGVLTVDHGEGASRLFLRDGIPIGAQSFTAFRPLGAALLAAGIIEAAALERSLAEMARSGRRQGDILVEMRAVTPAQVDAALAEQQTAYLSEVASLTSGRFWFDASAAVPDWTEAVHISPLNAIVQALETPQASPLVFSALQLAASGPISLAPGYGRLARAFGWSATEASLVQRLASVTTLDAFFVDPGVAPERARAIVAALLLLGLAAPRSLPADAIDAVPALVVDLADLAGVAIEPESPPPSAVTRPAHAGTGAEERPPAPSPRRSDPEEARRRRQRLLHLAMQNMGLGPLSRLARAPATPARTGDGRVPPERAAKAGEAESVLRSALAAVAPRARSADFFERLGIVRGATRDQVKTAYFHLARQLHPDRFSSASLADVAPQVKEFFTAINEAYEVLSDDRKRAAYLASTGGAGGVTTQADRDAASIAFQKAEACARTRDYARARTYYEAALRVDPRPEYQASYAWMLYHEPGSPDRARAKALATAALREGEGDKAALLCALLARDEGDDAGAERLLRRALEANPDNLDAQRELRVYDARRGRGRRVGPTPTGRKP